MSGTGTTERPAYASVPPSRASWWEAGLVRYVIMSYSLWARNIYWDLRMTATGVKRPKAGRPLDERLWWFERRWVWLWGR